MLYDIFEVSAARHPDRVALDIPPGGAHPQRVRLTYAQLRLMCAGLAAKLAPLARPDTMVAIFLPRHASALYAAQLAVLKTGAAFTCIDPAFPDAHLAQVLSDAAALITDPAGRRRAEAACRVLPPVIESAVIEPGDTPPSALFPAAAQGSQSDLAYVIYTSGTTGSPKGVMIEHRAIINLVTGDAAHFGLTCEARVAQCSSPAYDSSIEETWLAFAAGAALVPLDDEMVRMGPDLVPLLARERITVLCPPPTLLRATGCADPARALPDLSLLYVGGEPLAADLADRWSAGLRMENGYGPTECTVTATRARVLPGEAVTIGRPVPGCDAHVLDEALRPMADGESGELCITGAGLARGYHKQEALTREKFLDHPDFGRLYRTGDRVRRNAQGELEYLGRIDAQVKLRGYRMELTGIEALLAASPGIRAAACKVQGEGGGQILTAHLVAADRINPPAVESVKDRLRQTLPHYMIPARVAFVDMLPVTVGGKLDRKALSDIAATGARNIVAPRNDAERIIADAFRHALKLKGQVSVADDFFLDLGGDSLSAVEVICILRGGDQEAIAVRDLYEARTAARLAECLAGRLGAQPAPAARGAIPPAPAVHHGRPLLCSLAQGLWLAVEFVAGGALMWTFFFLLLPVLTRGLDLTAAIAMAAAAAALALLIYLPLSIAWTVLLKNILIGRYHSLRAPVWGGFFLRHWIVTKAAALIPWPLLQGTPFAAIALRALGARIGKGVHIHRGIDLRNGGWDLLEMGDGVTLAQDVAVRLTELENGEIVIGPIIIGDNATVDIRGGLSPGSAIDSGGYLAPHSWLPSGVRIGPGERWDGVPARPAGAAPAAPAVNAAGDMLPGLYGTLLLVGECVMAMGIAAMPLLLAAIAWAISPNGEARLLSWFLAPSFTATGVAIACATATAAVSGSLLLSALAMRLIGPVRPGAYGQWSMTAMRIWTKTAIVQAAGRWLSGSMAWVCWLRLAGMSLGPGCEISTLIDVLPETVRIGRGSFFADGIYCCAPWRHRGVVVVTRTSIGRGTFLGNHAVIPAGHDWPDGLFVGVSTVADRETAYAGSAWFGHPPMELPRRETVAADPRLTTHPGPLRIGARLFWELLRLALPWLPVMIGGVWYILLTDAARHVHPVLLAFAVAPLLMAAGAMVSCLMAAALKWLVLGRMHPGQHGFWSCWCGRWDFLFVAWSIWAAPWLKVLEGTLMLNAFLRLTGVRLGRRVVLGPGFSQVVDPDMLVIGDDATLSCHMQAHSFEDRILKLDHIHVGRGVTVGQNAVLFFGIRIGEGALVDPQGVVMKRDALAPGMRYQGCPTRPVAGGI